MASIGKTHNVQSPPKDLTDNGRCKKRARGAHRLTPGHREGYFTKGGCTCSAVETYEPPGAVWLEIASVLETLEGISRVLDGVSA